MHQTNTDDAMITVPDMALPEYVPPTEAELARRRELAAKIAKLRERIGPIGIRADELLHQAQAESEG